MFDILIVGAGVIGSSIARELSKYDLNIGIIEKEPDICMGSSKANSAIVHGGYAESHDKVKGRMCYKGRSKFEELDKELNFGYKKIGSMVLAERKEDLQELERLKENGERNGLTDLKIIDFDGIKEREPNIESNFEYALLCEGAGVCSPFEYTIALMENAIDNGVKLFLNEEVLKIHKNNDIFTITTDKNTFQSKIVVNCGGLNSGNISNMVGDDRFNISYRSGEYLVFNKTEGSKINSVLFQMPTKLGKGILITQTIYGNLIIGPDALNEKSLNWNTDETRLSEIYKKSKLITNVVDSDKLIRTFAGVRAVSSTDDFVIEESSVKNFINVAGIQSPGLTSSPAIAEYVVELIGNMNISLKEKNDFNPTRKGYGNYETNNYEEKDLVCICEQRNEKDIMQCFERNIPINTIDAIKRRVRAGMGPCQGMRCSKNIKKILDGKNIQIDYRTDIEIKNIQRVNRFKLIKELKQQ